MLHYDPKASTPMAMPHQSSPASGCLSGQQPVPTVTDWNWFMDFVGRGGEPSLRRYENWIARRDGFSSDWQERLEEFKGFRHEKLYLLKPSDFDKARRHMGHDHALGDLDKDRIEHRLSANFSPPVPFMYPFHALLESLGYIPGWWDVWNFLVLTRPDLVMRPYAAYNGLTTKDALFTSKPYIDAFRWRLGLVFYSWYREIHLLTELRCVHRLDVRYHFAADAEWKADLIGGDVLLELFVRNESYKTEAGEGRKETCAAANPWARPVRHGFANRRLWGRPYLLEKEEVAKVAGKMLAAGCPVLD